MSKIYFTSKGDWKDIRKFLKQASKGSDDAIRAIMEKYGEEGSALLSEATPVETGLLKGSWSYEIDSSQKGVSTITWHNDDVENGYNIVMLVVYGHGLSNGGYVQPNDFVTPAIDNLLEELADEAWKEVSDVCS